MARILIAGMDGYIGWSLAMHLAAIGHDVAGFDNYARRRNVARVGSISAIPIRNMDERLKYFKDTFRRNNDNGISFKEGSTLDFAFLRDFIKSFKPDAIVHLGEQPSAPFSMIDRRHSIYTQQNNVIGTLNLLYAMKETMPDCHLVKLGTMGEYGTPNIQIPEGFFEVEYKGRKDVLPFPRLASSWYHWSKVHDSNNIMFACKLWGLRSTDIMQGVVYGTRTGEMVKDELLTRFDFDEVFGTVLNRFCAQAVIGHKLTPYGEGGQTRGFIALIDSIQCLTIAIANPPDKGEYSVFNQLSETYQVNELAKIVQDVSRKRGIDVEIEAIENPRVEKENHFYEVEVEKLPSLGFNQTRNIEEEIAIMLNDLLRFKQRILAKKQVILPKPYWKIN